ncbi:MAG: hypothetical protein L6Q73_14310 [Aquabacterium sp.]|nr:hypothetical protein [Aquabacterium sp.]
MVANAHRLHLDLTELRRRFPVSLKGATLAQLARAAIPLHRRAGVRSPRSLRSPDCPATGARTRSRCRPGAACGVGMVTGAGDRRAPADKDSEYRSSKR